MADNYGNSIKDSDTYEALREDGASKEKATRIANAQANDGMKPSEKGGKAKPYEERTKDELYERAQELGANAVVAIDLDYEVVGKEGGMLMVSVSGTAVRID